MGTSRVLVVGIDPRCFPEFDADAALAKVEAGQARFAEHGIGADLCLVAPDETAEPALVAALGRGYECVVIGGGIRTYEPLLELFERVINLVHRHAPSAAIAFNTSPLDSVDRAMRWLP